MTAPQMPEASGTHNSWDVWAGNENDWGTLLKTQVHNHTASSLGILLNKAKTMPIRWETVGYQTSQPSQVMVVFNLSARVITLNMQSDFAQVGLLGQALKAVRSSFDARICIFGHIGWGYREQK